MLSKHLPLTEKLKKKKKGNWTLSAGDFCLHQRYSAVTSCLFVSLPVTVVMWLEEQEALLWTQLVPVQ